MSQDKEKMYPSQYSADLALNSKSTYLESTKANNCTNTHTLAPPHLQPALSLQQLAVQDLSVPHGPAKLIQQPLCPLVAQHRDQKLLLHLQQAQTLLQLQARLQEPLERERGEMG